MAELFRVRVHTSILDVAVVVDAVTALDGIRVAFRVRVVTVHRNSVAIAIGVCRLGTVDSVPGFVHTCVGAFLLAGARWRRAPPDDNPQKNDAQ